MELAHRNTSGRLPTSTFELVDRGEVLGFAQIRHRPSHSADLPPEAANHVYYQIAEPSRGRGYGKALLGFALREARKIGLSRVRLTCENDNPASRRIIESNGGVCVGEFKTRDGRQVRLFEISLQ